MFLHVEHAQQMQKGKTWCGAEVNGPRVIGVDNLLYHAAGAKTGAICAGCLEAILNQFGAAVRRTQSEGGV